MLKLIDLGKRVYLDGEPVGRPIKWDTMQVLAALTDEEKPSIMLKVTRKGMKTSELIIMAPETASTLSQQLSDAVKLADYKKTIDEISNKEAKDA